MTCVAQLITGVRKENNRKRYLAQEILETPIKLRQKLSLRAVSQVCKGRDGGALLRCSLLPVAPHGQCKEWLGGRVFSVFGAERRTE